MNKKIGPASRAYLYNTHDIKYVWTKLKHELL